MISNLTESKVCRFYANVSTIFGKNTLCLPANREYMIIKRIRHLVIKARIVCRRERNKKKSNWLYDPGVLKVTCLINIRKFMTIQALTKNPKRAINVFAIFDLKEWCISIVLHCWHFYLVFSLLNRVYNKRTILSRMYSPPLSGTFINAVD